MTRTYLLGRQINSQSKSIASIFLERFTGLIALIILVLIFSLINIKLLEEPLIRFSVITVIAGSMIFFIVFFSPGLTDALSRKLGFTLFLRKFFSKLKTLHDDIMFFKNRYALLSLAMFYSFVFHMLTSVNVYLTCLSIGFNPSFLDIAVVTPIILLVASIPVSPNNLGWWEWAFSVLLVGAGAGVHEGLAVALTLRGISIITSFFGGIFLIFEKVELLKSKQVLPKC